MIAQRAAACSATARRRRAASQEEGRARARAGDDPLHFAGCTLYWAEGSKDRNRVVFTNSDAAMLILFRRFLTESMHIDRSDITLALNVYTNNGLTIEHIEQHWLTILELPRACVRKHMLNHTPTSSSGKSKRRLLYGVCTLSVGSTAVIQHIYGAIQEYGGFEEPKWLG